MKPCLHCEELTNAECVCGHAYCSACQKLYDNTLCPLCVRVNEIRLKQAMLSRIVPWQHIDTTTSMLLSVGRSTDPGAVTVPVPNVALT